MAGRMLPVLLVMLMGSLSCSRQTLNPTQTPSETPPASRSSIEALLPGDYLGEGSRGAVYHRIVPLNVPALGGRVYYHHISMEGFGGPAAQRKVYAFVEQDRRMRSTVLLESDVTLTSNREMARQLAGLKPRQMLRFPDGCMFEWTGSDDEFVAHVNRSRCSYESPAFGGRVSPQMTYTLNPCGLAIREAIYREDGSPVFPPADVQNRRVTAGRAAPACGTAQP